MLWPFISQLNPKKIPLISINPFNFRAVHKKDKLFAERSLPTDKKNQNNNKPKVSFKMSSHNSIRAARINAIVVAMQVCACITVGLCLYVYMCVDVCVYNSLVPNLLIPKYSFPFYPKHSIFPLFPCDFHIPLFYSPFSFLLFRILMTLTNTHSSLPRMRCIFIARRLLSIDKQSLLFFFPIKISSSKINALVRKNHILNLSGVHQHQCQTIRACLFNPNEKTNNRKPSSVCRPMYMRMHADGMHA